MALYDIINGQPYLDDDKTAIAIVSIPRNFDPGDRTRFENKIANFYVESFWIAVSNGGPIQKPVLVSQFNHSMKMTLIRHS
jgi:hypothetical protein